MSERSKRLFQRSLFVTGIMIAAAGAATDFLGMGTRGFGFGPAQQAIVCIGVTFLFLSGILGVKSIWKKASYTSGLAIILFLVWSLWLYPASGYRLNPFGPLRMSEGILVVSHVFILILSLALGGVAALMVLRAPAKPQTVCRKDKSSGNSFAQNKGGGRLEKTAIIVFATLIIGIIACICFFVHPSEEVDDLTLYNPVYTSVTTGQMTYPTHYFFDAMYVHPPVRSLLIAWLMELGCNSFYASTLPIFLCFLLGGWLIVKGPFCPYQKISLLFGMLAPLLLFFVRPVVAGPVEISAPFGPVLFDSLRSTSSIRPDVLLALAWFSGLIALESARVEGWSSRKLLLGSFLLTFASGLHYFAWTAWMGTLVYIAWALRDLGLKHGLKKIVLIIIGMCCFGVPYLVLFALPQFKNISNLADLLQGEGGIITALNRHIGQYMYNLRLFPSDYSPYLLMVLRPVWALKIPLAFFGWVFLIFPKRTKGLALSSLFLTLFVCLYSRGKSSGYYIPELMIYLSGIALGLSWLVQTFAARVLFPKRVRYSLILSTLALAVACIKGNFYLEQTEITLKPYRHEMHLARICAKDIVGPAALVAGRMRLWYAGGAAYWYGINHDLLYNKDISDINLTAYFSRFDAIVDQHHFGNISDNNLHATLSSWYADGLLHLKGVYLTNSGPGLNMLFLSAKVNERPALLGYGLYAHDMLFRFERDDNGDYVFVSIVGSTFGDFEKLKAHSLFYNGIPLPNPNMSNAAPVDIHKIQRHIYTFLLDRGTARAMLSELEPEMLIRDVIACKIVPVEIDTMLQKLKKEQPIIFYRSLDEVKPSGEITEGEKRQYVQERQPQ